MEASFFHKYAKYNILLFFLIILAVSLYIMFSFISAIIAAAIVAYVFYPMFKVLNKRIKSKAICAGIMILTVTLIIIIPLFFVFNVLFIEAANFYQGIGDIDLAPLSNFMSNLFDNGINVEVYVRDIASSGFSFLMKTLSDFFLSLPQKILMLFITIFSMYYFFKDGDKVLGLLKGFFPLHRARAKVFLDEFNKIINATIYGVFVSAVIQGILGTFGLIIFDVSSPIVWGSIMVLAAMIPIVGTWIIWFPAAIFKLLNGDLFNGFGLLIYGILIVSTIDNFVKPKLISGKAKIHPLLIVLGVFGGLKVFGIIGILIGPLFLSMMLLLYKFYVKKLK
ncbi:MAG: AI-2E family transporter [Nanoarchaeota archaeon]|nr:AI-2E family transporter [Nanoarchaeota archaeon]